MGHRTAAEKLDALLLAPYMTEDQEKAWDDFELPLQVVDTFAANDATNPRYNPVQWTTALMPPHLGPLPLIPTAAFPPLTVGGLAQPIIATPSHAPVPTAPASPPAARYTLPDDAPDPVVVDGKSLIVVPVDEDIDESRVVRFAIPAGQHVIHAWVALPEDEPFPGEPAPDSWDVPPTGAAGKRLGNNYKRLWNST